MKPNLWVGTQSNPDDRLKLCVSDTDRAKYDALPHGASEESVTLTDIPTGKTYRIRRASCGLGCFCAAELVLEGVPSVEERKLIWKLHARKPEIVTMDFEFAHGKKPKGYGMWAFATRRNPLISSIFYFTGNYGEAKRAAREHFTGNSLIFVLS